MIIGLHHPGIVVPDLKKAVTFYCDVLDFTVFKEMTWQAPNTTIDQITGLKDSAATVCLLKGQNCYLEIFEFTSRHSNSTPEKYNAADFGIRHLAFQVEDAHKIYQKLQKHGGQVINEPATVIGGGTAVYCRDPFGNLIEFTTVGGKFPSLSTL